MNGGGAPWDAATACACGIDWLLAETAPAGPLGAALRARRRPFLPGDEARARAEIAGVIRLAGEAGAEGLAALRREIGRVPDVTVSLRRAPAGERLDDPAFFELAALLAGLEAVLGIAAGYGFTLDAALDVRQGALGTALRPALLPEGGFYLADAFDSALAAARERARAASVTADLARGRLERAVALATGRDVVPAGEFVVMRDAVPEKMPRGLRVVRETPAYLLCELALDDEALAALGAAEAAAALVAEREDAVRSELSAIVAAEAEALGRALVALGELDVLVAAAGYCRRHACCLPEIAASRAVDLREVRYLPLAREGARFVPIDIALGDLSVLTGPNMGGKTTALRTLGFAAACLALGLPVPASSARLPLFACVRWLAPDDADAGASELSSFGREVAGAIAVLHDAEKAPPALVLIDEFARTTAPSEGRALLVALLEGLRARGALAFAATHASGVAAAGGATALAVAGLRRPLDESEHFATIADAVAALRERMDYRIVPLDETARAPGEAIVLARALGLDPAIAARAAQIEDG